MTVSVATGGLVLAADINDLQDQIDNIAGGQGFAFGIAGNAYVATKIQSIVLPKDVTFSKIWAYADTAPTGADMNIDVNLNGVSIITGTLAIAASANAANTTTLATTAGSEGDRLSWDVDQIGSTVAGGSNLMVTIEID